MVWSRDGPVVYAHGSDSYHCVALCPSLFPGHEGVFGGTDSSDSTDHQHEDELTPRGNLNFPAHHALGDNAYFVTSVTPGGGRELLFADDYNEADADVIPDSEDDVTLDDDVTQEEDDAGGNLDDEDEEDDVTYDAGEGELEGEGLEEGQGMRRGGFRRAKAVALQRLAELAHFEHPRIA